MKAATYVSNKPCKKYGHLLRYVAGNHNCVECARLNGRQYHEQNRERRNAYLRKWHKSDHGKKVLKTWRTANRDLMTEWRKKNHEANREKRNAISRANYAKQAAERRAYARAYATANKLKRKEAHRRWREKNLEYVKKKHLEWRTANPERVRALTMKRHAQKLRATPKWLTEQDHESIVAIYAKAVELTRITGITHHVDHVVPLQGKKVSGLHVPSNLRVLTQRENCSKRNTFEEATETL